MKSDILFGSILIFLILMFFIFFLRNNLPFPSHLGGNIPTIFVRRPDISIDRFELILADIQKAVRLLAVPSSGI